MNILTSKMDNKDTGVRLSVIETKLDAMGNQNMIQHLENKEEHKSILEFLKQELEKKADNDKVDSIVKLFTEKIDNIESMLKNTKADWKWIAVFIIMIVQMLYSVFFKG